MDLTKKKNEQAKFELFLLGTYRRIKIRVRGESSSNGCSQNRIFYWFHILKLL